MLHPDWLKLILPPFLQHSISMKHSIPLMNVTYTMLTSFGLSFWAPTIILLSMLTNIPNFFCRFHIHHQGHQWTLSTTLFWKLISTDHLRNFHFPTTLTALLSSLPPLPCYIPVFGYFSRNIPGCFVMRSKGFKKGDIIRLGGSEMWEAVVEGMGCVGRDFISYDIHEVGCLPIGSHLTTQLIAPLSSCKPFFLQLLIMVYVTIFSPFIQSSVVFGEDLQDPCAGTEGYAGSLDEAERGVVWRDWFSLLCHYSPSPPVFLSCYRLLLCCFTMVLMDFCLACFWLEVVIFDVICHGVLINSEYLE